MSVKKVIDEWDPVDLLSHAPEDEYESEIAEIEGLLQESKDAEIVAEGIKYVFNKYFSGIFTGDIEECREIANLVLKDSDPDE